MGGIVAEMVVVVVEVVVVVACVYALIMRKVGKVERNGTRGSLECDGMVMMRCCVLRCGYLRFK